MVRRTINILSPIAAMAVVWVSLQSFVMAENGAETAPLLDSPTTVVERDLLPELGAVSRILETTSTGTPAESVPEAVKRLLASNGSVLLVPVGESGGDR